MLFHSLSGPEVHGVIDEMDRRAKSEAPAISSAIDRGDTETTMPSISSDRAALCAGCGGKISDRYYLLAVDKQWHMRCLKCCECKLNLESELTCFSKDGSIYCKEDYYRRFSVQRCARCHLGISASEMVMRARDLVYHLNCFTCTTCNKMLTTGDHFGMKDSLVYCRLHFEALLQGEYPAHFNHADVAAAAAAAAAAKSAGLGAAGANPLGLPYYNGVGTVQKGRPRKRKSPGPGADLAAYNAALSCNENDAEHLDRDQPYPSSQKTKRMRTSFKHHQLRTMKSYFAINHNPDAKDLKQLAQKTGLTKRVLQIQSQERERGKDGNRDEKIRVALTIVTTTMGSHWTRKRRGYAHAMKTCFGERFLSPSPTSKRITGTTRSRNLAFLVTSQHLEWRQERWEAEEPQQCSGAATTSHPPHPPSMAAVHFHLPNLLLQVLRRTYHP